jgi:hypothetical protein
MCSYCGNKTGMVDSRGMCISCGAQLNEQDDAQSPFFGYTPEMLIEKWRNSFGEAGVEYIKSVMFKLNTSHISAPDPNNFNREIRIA